LQRYGRSDVRRLIDVDRQQIIDMRQSAGGFDFGITDTPHWAIEVKGLDLINGAIQFTDHEWSEENTAASWLVVVGNLIKISPV
jgi:hypothetical protein